jgi:translation initiation factor 1
MSKKKKIPVGAPQAGLNNPFASLDATGLPPAPTPTSPSPNLLVPLPRPPPKLGRVVLRREKASRGGKTVVVIYDFPLTFHNKAIEELARDLRKACSCGGTVRDRTIEIQGDQVPKIRVHLEEMGFRVAGVT